MDRACRLRSCALVRRVRQGGEEVLAHVGCLHSPLTACFRGVLGFSWMFIRSFTDTPAFGISSSVVFTTCLCDVMVLTGLSESDLESSRRGGEEV